MELNIDGDLRMQPADRRRIRDTVTVRSYFGSPDEIASEVAERAKAEWQNSGYLKAEVQGEAHVLTSSPVNERIAVDLHVDEGQQYRLQGIHFRGNKSITNPNALRGLFPINDAAVVDRNAIAKGLENLRSAYGQYGYVNAAFVPDVQFNEGNQTVSLEVDIREGRQFYVSQIDIVGLSEAAFDRVKKELPIVPGQVYNQRLVDLFVRNHESLLPTDDAPEKHVKLDADEERALVALTYDFRGCRSN
jgi:outer membrane protein insertion porin family